LELPEHVFECLQDAWSAGAEAALAKGNRRTVNVPVRQDDSRLAVVAEAMFIAGVRAVGKQPFNAWTYDMIQIAKRRADR
jgi:hypothetical protein